MCSISWISDETLIYDNDIPKSEATNMTHTDWTEIDEEDTDREVAGIVYKLFMTYGTDESAKRMAQTEAYFNRLKNRYARAMRVTAGPKKGQWGCYVSRCEKGW